MCGNEVVLVVGGQKKKKKKNDHIDNPRVIGFETLPSEKAIWDVLTYKNVS